MTGPIAPLIGKDVAEVLGPRPGAGKRAFQDNAQTQTNPVRDQPVGAPAAYKGTVIGCMR